MNKKFIVFISALAIFILLVFLTFREQNPRLLQNSSVSPTADPRTEETAGEKNNIKISVDFGNGETIEDNVLLKKPSTAFGALLALTDVKKLNIQTKQYDFGVFVESINGVGSNKNKAWIYFINGKSGSVAADKQEVAEGDLIEWKYTTPSVE